MPDLIPGVEQVYFAIIHLITVAFGGLAALQIPAPVGVLGLWRWSIWLFRRFIGLFYRPQPVTGFMLTTSVVTPVYNEVPEVFDAALRSWAANRPTEIIAIIDHSDQKSVEVFRALEAEWATAGIRSKMVITPTPGKRPALVDGMLEASGEVICLVDSDTIWAPDVLINVMAPFEDPRVGGVTTRQSVLAHNSLAQRIFDVYLDIRYEDEVRFLTALKNTPFGDAVTCLSGRTAVYRRAAVLPVLEGLLRERFLGQRVISGDDKALTLLVQSHRWKIRYQETARVYTPGATEMRVFLKQRLRWARNSWRADLKALGSSWAWRKPLLAFHLIDRLLQPLTTIVAPIFVTIAIFRQHWLAVFVVVTWWFVSRTIKLWPHIKRDWRHISILPSYVFFNYWSAVMRIYAFFTMNQQGWITRWNKNRMALLGPLRVVPAYAGTVFTIALVGFGIFLKGLSAEGVAKAPGSPPPVAVISTQEQALADDSMLAQIISQPAAPEDSPQAEWTPLYSPDGRQILFVAGQANEVQLFIRDAESGLLRELLAEVKSKSKPVWSPDSRKVAVFVGNPDQMRMQTVDIFTNEVRFWEADRQQAMLAEFGWSPTVRTHNPQLVTADRQANPTNSGAVSAQLAMQPVGPLSIATTANPAEQLPEIRVARSVTAETVVAPASQLQVQAEKISQQQRSKASSAARVVATTNIVDLQSASSSPPVAVALAATPEPTATPQPTATPTVEPTATVATPTPTAEPTLPPAPIFEGTPTFYLLAIVPASHPVNARYSAGPTAPVLMLLEPSLVLSAIGRTADNTWLQVILPDQRLGWVATEVVVIDWNYIDSLPIVTAPLL